MSIQICFRFRKKLLRLQIAWEVLWAIEKLRLLLRPSLADCRPWLVQAKISPREDSRIVQWSRNVAFYASISDVNGKAAKWRKLWPPGNVQKCCRKPGLLLQRCSHHTLATGPCLSKPRTVKTLSTMIMRGVDLGQCHSSFGLLQLPMPNKIRFVVSLPVNPQS